MRQKGSNNIDLSALFISAVRLNFVDDHVVCPTQTTFMQGRNIVDGVVILYETVHEIHQKR
jgi:hypothetical protein